MAESPAHKLGQIIGDALEIALEPVLRAFAEEHDLYLDVKGNRPARPGVKVTWTDDFGNSHDLDFVLERAGTPEKVGVPAAFIESAWRRYTKHSKNKAQEIQGAVEPLLAKYANVKPFGGAIVGGNWTANALAQLTSLGFSVLYIPYDDVVRAFATVGIDVATEEDTPLDRLQEMVDRYEALTPEELDRLGAALRECAPSEFARFRVALESTIARRVERVTVLPLHGSARDFESLGDAIDAIESYETPDAIPLLVRWEVAIRFSNGDRIEARFQEPATAVDFLRTFG